MRDFIPKKRTIPYQLALVAALLAPFAGQIHQCLEHHGGHPCAEGHFNSNADADTHAKCGHSHTRGHVATHCQLTLRSAMPTALTDIPTIHDHQCALCLILASCSCLSVRADDLFAELGIGPVPQIARVDSFSAVRHCRSRGPPVVRC